MKRRFNKAMSPKRKKVVCECLQVTEDDVIEAIRTRELRTVEDVTRYTEAGGGCTACHPSIKQYLAYLASSASPSCSDK
ncbi:MAG: (2Fe-2S)-binding protein [Elusimicrobia bacterium]|nr:(2Fe-2S)-binding protein [Elusimicrobiota bacterium]